MQTCPVKGSNPHVSLIRQAHCHCANGTDRSEPGNRTLRTQHVRLRSPPGELLAIRSALGRNRTDAGGLRGRCTSFVLQGQVVPSVGLEPTHFRVRTGCSEPWSYEGNGAAIRYENRIARRTSVVRYGVVGELRIELRWTRGRVGYSHARSHACLLARNDRNRPKRKEPARCFLGGLCETSTETSTSRGALEESPAYRCRNNSARLPCTPWRAGPASGWSRTSWKECRDNALVRQAQYSCESI